MKTVKELMDLNGKVALVTGGSGHIGYTICETLAELGASILILDLKESDGQKLAEDIKNKYVVKATFISCDLAETGDIAKVPELIDKFSSRLDILVNCAALVGTSGLEGWAVPLLEQSIQTWKKALDVNLTGSFQLIQECIPMLEKQKGSSIINLGSIYGIAGMDMTLYEGRDYITPAAYAASKGGLTQLTRYLGTALAPDIRVNTISPGGIERGQDPEFQKRYKAKTPLNRMGIEEDLKGAVAYLASDLSAYVTGQNIVVDGGWTL